MKFGQLVLTSFGDPEERPIRILASVISYGAAHPSPVMKTLSDPTWTPKGALSAAESLEQLQQMSAYFTGGDPAQKSNYKFVHHSVEGDLIEQALRFAGDLVNGEYGNVGLPNAEIYGIKTHLARHFHEIGEYAPWETAE